MKTIILATVLLISTTAIGQINWVTEFSTAKSLCKNSGKLMVIDFWADWCPPCKVMEKELWENSENKIDVENFVAVKIDVTKDRNTAERFNVEGIPMVVIAMAYGTVLWQRVGYSDKDIFIQALNAIPDDVSELYKHFYNINAWGKDSKRAYDIALQFQRLAFNIEHDELKDEFLRKDKEFFKKSLKYNSTDDMKQDIEIHLLLNDVCKGKPEKALKKFNKLTGGAKKCNNKELAHFFLASCYNKMGNKAKFDEEYAMLTKNEYKNQLKQPK